MIQSAKSFQVQGVFRALADPTRREILILLTEQDRSIRDVIGHFDVTRAAIKKHLVVLEDGGLISVHQNGRERINRLEPKGLKTVDDWLHHFHQFWDDKLGNLKTVAEKAERSNQKKENSK